MATTSYLNVGTYTVTVTALLYQPSPNLLHKTTSTTFTLTVLNDCDETSLIDKTFNNMSVKVT